MELNFKKFGQGFPLIILHGFLGSLDNWQSIAKKLASNFEVYIIDQRNHGKSPHSNDFSYQLLAEDLFQFFKNNHISKANIIGHSMGGKTAMQLALLHPEMVEKLVVVDIAPSEYEDGHSDVFKALLAADVEHATSREQVLKVLNENLNGDTTTVGFLMKSLSRNESGEHFEWKFNLPALIKNYDKISGIVTGEKPFTGSTLFIKGEKSNYINSSNYAEITQLFPNHQLLEIPGAGHWVHADKPQEFVDAVMAFFN